MACAVYVCEICGYRGTSPVVHSSCKTVVSYVDKENAWCPTCRIYAHGYSATCDGCGRHLQSQQVHFEPLD
jgi:hypothetical protein